MKYLAIFAVSVVLGSALRGVSQSPAAHQPAVREVGNPVSDGALKIAVVEFQAAVSQTNEFQGEYAELQSRFDPKREQLKKLSDQIDALTKQLQSQSASLSDTERTARARDIEEKKKQLDRATQDAESDYQSDMQEMANRIASKVGETMTDYAQKHGFTLVLDATQEQKAPIVLYWLPSSDITKALIEVYNEKSGVPAQPARATPDAPRPSTTH